MIEYHQSKRGFCTASSIFTFICTLFFILPLIADAFAIDKKLPSHAMEARAIEIFKITRCMVCSGESLHESQSAYAGEMRSMIRRNILNGMTDEEILDDLKKRYGSRILETTPRNKHSYFLWGAQIFFALVVVVSMLIKYSFIRHNAVKHQQQK